MDLAPEEDEALTESEAAAERGEFVSDAEVRAIWAKYDLKNAGTPIRAIGKGRHGAGDIG